MKSAGRLVFALSVWALSGCGGSVEAKHYDQACTQDSDCVPVYSGPLCQACDGCPNAAINSSARAAYEKDVAGISASCPPRPQVNCSPCYPPVARCATGSCVLGPP